MSERMITALVVSIDTWTLLVTVIFGLAGAVAAFYGYKSFRASTAQLELARGQAEDSREQLELARDQASQVPRIELMEFSGHPLSDDPKFHDEIRRALREMNKRQREREEEEQAERERERREREKREKKEREARERKKGFNAETVEQMEDSSLSDLVKRMAEPKKPLVNYIRSELRQDSLASPYLSRPYFEPPKYVYEGPVPNYYIDIGIRNVGRAAAYDVTGWVWFDKEILEPVEHFTQADVTVVEEKYGKVKVELSVRNEGGRLFPSHNDPYSFRIPVLVYEAVDTPINYEFTSPQGEPAHGTFNLLLASGRRQE